MGYMAYQVDSKSYLERAYARLTEGAPESLFYAAFELRCGIEQRLREYLEEQEHVENKEKEGWRVARLGRAVDKAFGGNIKIAKLTVYDSDKTGISRTYYYTPVNSELRSMAGQLGGYLHAPITFHRFDDPYWNDFKNLLASAYKGLEIACFGDLKGPPLLHSSGVITLAVSLDDNDTTFRDLSVGDLVYIKVEYLDDLPTQNL